MLRTRARRRCATRTSIALRKDSRGEAGAQVFEPLASSSARRDRPGAAARSRPRRSPDLARLRVREEQAPVGVDDDDAVGRALEEVGVALERPQAPLGLEAGDGDLLRLIAQRLQDARVAERDGHRVRDRAAERQLVLAEARAPASRAGRARPSAAPRRGWAGSRATRTRARARRGGRFRGAGASPRRR